MLAHVEEVAPFLVILTSQQAAGVAWQCSLNTTPMPRYISHLLTSTAPLGATFGITLEEISNMLYTYFERMRNLTLYLWILQGQQLPSPLVSLACALASSGRGPWRTPLALFAEAVILTGPTTLPGTPMPSRVCPIVLCHGDRLNGILGGRAMLVIKFECGVWESMPRG